MKYTLSTTPTLILEQDKNRGMVNIQALYANGTVLVYLGYSLNLKSDGSNAFKELQGGDSMDGIFQGKIYAVASSGTLYIHVDQRATDGIKQPPII